MSAPLLVELFQRTCNTRPGLRIFFLEIHTAGLLHFLLITIIWVRHRGTDSVHEENHILLYLDTILLYDSDAAPVTVTAAVTEMFRRHRQAMAMCVVYIQNQ